MSEKTWNSFDFQVVSETSRRKEEGRVGKSFTARVSEGSKKRGEGEDREG